MLLLSLLLCLVTGLFFLAFFLNQRWNPPPKLQVSYCSTFLMMCDVPLHLNGLRRDNCRTCFIVCSGTVFPIRAPVTPEKRHITILLLLLLLGCCCVWSQAFSSWHFSWTNGEPHRPGFKFHNAVLPLRCVMFHVQLSFVVSLLNVFLVWLTCPIMCEVPSVLSFVVSQLNVFLVQLPNFSLNLLLLFR